LRDNVIPQVNSEDVVFVSFTVETNDTDANMAAYQDENDFDWAFAVATPELISGLTTQFGAFVTIPPSQPHFIIYPDGTTTGLLTGMQDPAETLRLLAAGSAS
jgi:cytochrome oxidase Cu insertion factor (SCO1/SenC/PrrC family)